MKKSRYSLEEQEILAASFLSRCRAIARVMTRRRRWMFDEAESVALVALNEAIQTYDPKRGTFTPHADSLIKNRIIDYIRGERPKGHGGNYCKKLVIKELPISINKLDHNNSNLLYNERDKIGWEIESEDSVLRLSRSLPKRYGDIIRLKYLYADSESPVGLAKRMGLQVARTVQIHRKALEMLREQS